MSQNLLSAAVVIGAWRVKNVAAKSLSALTSFKQNSVYIHSSADIILT